MRAHWRGRREGEREVGERERERTLFSRLPQRGCSLALAVSSSVFDFTLTCRHYAIRFGQPPVEKAPSWSWISITVVMATAIDSTGVRVDGEENGENERAGERTTADGRRGGQGCLAEEERERGGILGRERTSERARARERPRRGCEGKGDRGSVRTPTQGTNARWRSTEGMVLLWWCYTALPLSDTMQAK